ncbi:SRPBCC family protein [Saccharopolyspora sp. MS10]|uniref:SRPBCC family protein n=1 Tax=Saccharopolyspora sp. MS10 TaxID=3385973 RepID=UPI0039A1C6D4
MQHHFTVPVPVAVAWPALIDPERVAPCMPGATLGSAEGAEFTGAVKVKLGPISLLYKGTGSFQETDEVARRIVIDAAGKDSRGNGTASATVVVTLRAEGSGTAAQVDTDLKVTGKPAQLGRGLMSEVGGKILNQFAENLARSLRGEAASEVAKSAGPVESAPERESGRAEEPSGGGEPDANEERARSAARHPSNVDRPFDETGAAAEDLGARVGRSPAWRVTSPASERTATVVPAEAPVPRRPQPAATPMPETEAIDLLGTAGAPVLKRALPALAVVVLAIMIIRRLRR